MPQAILSPYIKQCRDFVSHQPSRKYLHVFRLLKLLFEMTVSVSLSVMTLVYGLLTKCLYCSNNRQNHNICILIYGNDVLYNCSNKSLPWKRTFCGIAAKNKIDSVTHLRRRKHVKSKVLSLFNSAF